MAFQPPAWWIPLLWKDRSAARLLDCSHQIVFDFVALQRRRQKLVYLDDAIRRAMRDAKLQYESVPHIQCGEQNDQRHHKFAPSTFPFPH